MSVRVAFACVLSCCVVAWAAPPTGRRSIRPRATHVVLTDTTLEVRGLRARLKPGVALIAAATAGKATGLVKATVVGHVRLEGMIDGRVLGLRAIRSAELVATDGRTVGQLRAGTLVRPIGRDEGGQVTIEVVGEVLVKARVARDALTAEPRELVLEGEWTHRAAKELELFASGDLEGGSGLRLAEGARLVALTTDGNVAYVKSYGTVEAEGYVPMAELVPRTDGAKRGSEPAPERPTHEAFIDTTLYAASDEKTPLGTLRGGTLLQMARQLSLNEFVQVTTLGDVRITAYVKRKQLRPMEESVWRDR